MADAGTMSLGKFIGSEDLNSASNTGLTVPNDDQGNPARVAVISEASGGNVGIAFATTEVVHSIPSPIVIDSDLESIEVTGDIHVSYFS